MGVGMTEHRHSAGGGLDLDDFRVPGLYLLFPDGHRLTLTHDAIQTLTDSYLSDPARIPPRVRQAVQYRPCAICPHQDAKICHAIPTVFPLLEQVDRFLSFDRITAAYREERNDQTDEEGMLHIVRTTMQRALQHVSILSLIHYCEVGRTYIKYFAGVIPFMDPPTMAERVYQNVYWDLHGDEQAVERLLATMRSEIDLTVHCQIERLHLICRHDAFINAFVNMHIATQFLAPDLLPELRARFAARTAPDAAGPHR